MSCSDNNCCVVKLEMCQKERHSDCHSGDNDCKDRECICAREIVSQRLCSQEIKSSQLNVDNENANNVCVSGLMKANNAEAFSLNANELCAQNGRVDRLCVNDLTVGRLNHCQQWRATVTFGANTTYTLGQPVNWDVIVDNPNSNIALAPFGYTVPESGYYSFNYHLDTMNLQGANIVSGQPVSVLSLLRNGVEIIDTQLPFLTFSNSQSANLSGLILLNAGDVITMKYEVFVIDQVLGLTQLVGTIDIPGNGTLNGNAFFSIHYLSSLNCLPTVCEPCVPVSEPCPQVNVDCSDMCLPDGCNFEPQQ